MNRASRTGCSHCHEPVTRYQLWCARCHTPIAAEPARPTPEVDRSLNPIRKSVQLYQQVLDDATQLSRHHDISESDLATVQRLYRALLDQHQHKLRQAELHAARQQCVNRVRWLIQPHVEQFQAAWDIASQTSRSFPDDPVLTDLVTQIQTERDRRQQASQADLQALRLLQTARQLAPTDPAAAEQLILQALNLAPHHPELLKSLQQIRQQQAATPAPAVAPVSTPVSSTAGATPSEPLLAELVNDRLVPAEVVTQAVSVTASEVSEAELEEPEELVESEELAEPVELGPSTWERIVETTSEWSTLLKPFLLDNVGWFVGAFLIIAGFVVLIVAFRQDIGENPILMWSIVFWTLVATAGAFFALAYVIRRRYPQLETTSNVLLTIVALLIPLVFAAAALTTMAA